MEMKWSSDMNNRTAKISLALAVSAIAAIVFVYTWLLFAPGIASAASKKFPDDYAEDTSPTTDDWWGIHDVTANKWRKVSGTNATKGFSASNFAAGTMPTARLGSGTANSTTFLRGDQSWAVPASGATLSAITAATAANTIANGNNTGQVWNWANTTDSTIAFTFGETTAATGGTQTLGVPNQVLGKFTTLAASTQSPLAAYSRGTHVFSVSPTSAQFLSANGTSTEPTYSFASVQDMGMYRFNGSNLGFAVAGARVFSAGAPGLNIPAGSGTAPSLTDMTTGNSGIFIGSDIVGISTTLAESTRFTTGVFQPSKASADAVAYSVNSRKARGTVAAPTVITTGDDLLTVSGFGYVGATNTYIEAARILLDSRGTITDTTTGVGGRISLETRTVAGAMTERLAIETDGAITVPTTITAVGTTGNQTINKPAGRVNIAASGTTVVITNSLVTANSIVMAVAATNDSTARVTNVVPAAGSFTINTVAVTAETAFNWFVVSQ